MSTRTPTKRTAKKTRERGAVAREGGVSAREGVGAREREVATRDKDYSARARVVRAKVESTLTRPVTTPVLARGLALYNKGLVHGNKTYSWIWTVSSPTSGAVYYINLVEGRCSCKGFEITGRTCKHIVAAGAGFVAREGS